MNSNQFIVIPANETHVGYAEQICEEMAQSAKARGTGIARRKPEYVANKMVEGKAVIALHIDGRWAGFCYIETWSHEDYVANSGLIVNPEFRQFGLAKTIKKRIFELSRKKYPSAKIFGLTTGFAVMKINSELGYEPVPYSELTQDESFWKGCESCINFQILQSKDKKNCLCTAMLWNPIVKEKELRAKIDQRTKAKERLKNMQKKNSLLKRLQIQIKKTVKKTTLF
ncbi:GNAT family N-acetyltransferase [Myroides pelagicus]|uniref:GNAT family N-acetyltransferase n=1 Tax=Myroides pelagicus TaxID=270914 RepID=A0A7K1GKL6_9FLAO|nr:GNAT family N-acetyltransferase [Myroides pelagicus]MEC4113258.1 GNAT family N-acetyltransferase [Myroides pelagicus]MTH29425.1 GNAT family N-acetyltransferase [Myroides pelagicus]